MSTEMDRELENTKVFLSKELPGLLEKLTTAHQPNWGLMTSHHMLEHLIVVYKMSIGRIKLPIITKEEDWPRNKAYLVKDSAMRRNVPSPTGKNDLQPLRTASLDEARQKVLKETTSFLAFAEAEPDFIADHPYGGPMNMKEWMLFHRKHIKHHLIQFGIIPDYE